jgi:hypothetical protein
MRGRGLGGAGMSIMLACLGLLVTAAVASAAPYTVVTCQGDNLRYSADAFERRATPDMMIVNACRPGPSPRGLITRNKIRPGKRVPYGAASAVVLHPPPGTVFTHLDWSGHGQRKECRFALEVYAEGPHLEGRLQTIVKRRARTTCPRRPDSPRRPFDADLDSVDWRLTGYDFRGGATQIVQRTICKSRHGCSATRPNYVRTIVANLTVEDVQVPTVSILPDTPLARGEWVRENQPLNYSASDNVGVQGATALIGGTEAANDQSRSCPAFVADAVYDQLIPCPNGPGTIAVRTERLAEGTQALIVRAKDSAGISQESAPLTARIDNTPPARVDVGIDGGDAWRNHNDFAAIWSNPPEGDRAPIVAAAYKLCPANGDTCARGELLGQDIARLPMPVPAPGEWKLSLWRRDAAGNANEGYQSVPATLRFDPDPPQLAFEPSPAADPTKISVQATDALSGVASGSVEIAREGSGIWQALVTDREGDRLVARVDDAVLPAGTYLLRARAIDGAGNAATTDLRVDGQPMILTLPLRVAARMEASIAVERGGRHPVTELKPTVRLRFGRPLRIRGRLVAPNGSGIADADVQVLARTVAAAEHPVEVLRTGPDGRFEYPTVADSSRTLRFLHAATPTVLPASAEVSLTVPAATTARVRPRHLRNGRSVTFSGRLRGLPVPSSGKLVELQVRFPTGWQTFRTIRTDGVGNWASRYRFTRTRGSVRYRFRARMPREAGYPFDTGVSRSVSVRVRGRR